MNKFKNWFGNFSNGFLQAIELIDFIFLVGLVSLGYGMEHIKHGSGFVCVGLLLIFWVKPLPKWWPK
jgi:hypothetical protein